MLERSLRAKGRFEELIESVVQKLAALGSELTASFRRENSAMLVFEKYFFRTGSYASLSLMLSRDGEYVIADTATSGAGNGFLNVSWGADESYMDDACEVLYSLGFEPMGDDAPRREPGPEAPPPEPESVHDIIKRGMAANWSKEAKKETKKKDKPDWEY